MIVFTKINCILVSIDSLIVILFIELNNIMCVIPPLTLLLCISTHIHIKTFPEWNFEKYLICIIKNFKCLLLFEENHFYNCLMPFLGGCVFKSTTTN